MTKILLFFAVSLAVIHEGIPANINRTDADISFVDTADESDAVREKIRTEMETYKKIKEMIIKNKLDKATTTLKIETTNEVVESETTTLSATLTLTEISVQPDTKNEEITPEVTSPEPAIEASSTVRKVELNIDTEEDDEETTEEAIEDATKKVDDRFILNAPNICKSGKVSVNGKCRPVV